MVSLPEAQQFLERASKIDGIEVYVKDLKWTDEVLGSIKRAIDGMNLQVRDWRELNQTLFHALRLEKWAMFVILSFVILVALLNVITTVSRSVLERKREISIFQAMGASKKQILLLFLVQGLFFGTAGILGGLGLGLGICTILSRYHLIRLPEIYYFTTVPVQVDLLQIGLIIGVAFVMTLLASLYPAWRAAELDPLEGIRS